ncbi:hypothetical protein FOA52_012858 [Chlamydomonas sp. UWO 241]|nr:hypothetical protein FOA52_012858 [Chlamydomonas sp. UWO 241]
MASQHATNGAAMHPHASTSAKGLGGAPASKSYNLASTWEASAALSDEQLQLVDTIHQACSQRPLPENIVDDRRAVTSGAPGDAVHGGGSAKGGGESSYVGTLEDAVLRNTNQFHKWHSELEAACALEMEEKYKRYADLLNSHWSSCESILGQVQQTLDLFEALLEQHRDVAQRSTLLYSSCEKIVREKDQLEEFADALRAKLKFFDEFEAVYSQFSQAQLSTNLDNEQFLSLLKKLDDCKSYVATNPQYADSSTYMTKFRQLQARAMGSVRSKVQAVLKAAAAQVEAAVKDAASGPSSGSASAAGGSGGGAAGQPSGGGATGSAAGAAPALAEGAEVSLLYVRFRAAAEPALKGLFREIEARSARPEYARLLEECQGLYCAARLQLISPFVSQRIDGLATQALPLLARNGCEHLLRVGQLEAQLFEQFFSPSSRPGAPPTNGSSSSSAAAASSATDHLVPVMEPLCNVLYDVLRPLVVQLADVDELCELVDILKHEVLGDQLRRRGPGADALVPTLSRTLADVQERLIFRAQAFIKEEVERYAPSPADLDYPGKLERATAAEAADAAAAAQQQRATGSSDANAENGDAGEAGASGADAGGSPSGAAAGAAGARPGGQYASLYPPVQSTLVCLSKLYRSIDARIFSGLAQEAVAACTHSIQGASSQVAKRSSPLDAQLFTVRHLLFLREQIAPFDVEFSSSDIDLDFSHMRDHMARILSGRSSLFSMSASNAVVRMLGTGGPRVLHYKVDSKKELEKQLKGVCEQVIMALTKVAVEPLLGFITKVTAVRVAAQTNPAAAKPIREQAFASPAKLAEMVSRVNEGMTGPLAAAASRMRLYLPNPGTYVILFKPVKSNLVEAHAQVASLLAAEYPPDEVAGVPLKSGDELAALLDSLSSPLAA